VTVLNNVIDPTKGETARLSYQIATEGAVTITVFTLDGNVVRRLYSGSRAVGDYSTAWDGKNLSGATVSRGVYFIRVVGPGIDEIRKVMVVRKP
jgi:flagellar hook assembly protein FlgD